MRTIDIENAVHRTWQRSEGELLKSRSEFCHV
ncbi:hypothetical protein J2046_004500 [Rhizobium petrolearium]|nr:hypothetical protein [Neorhizobium petrolearium]